MYTKRNVVLHLILVFLAFAPFVPSVAMNQGAMHKIELTWQAPRVISTPGSPLVTVLSFRGSALDQGYGLLPVLIKSFPVTNLHD
jgi:hypothetical protein